MTPPPVDPRVISPPRPGMKSHGRRLSRLAAAMGRPFIPWQYVAGELLDEYDPATGLRTRDLCVLTVQRQAGKTELIKSLIVERCLLDGPGRRVWYTAQTGQYAREKWAELTTELCAPGSPFAGYVAAAWAKGGECLTFPNGSTFRPFPPTRDALHSKQSDLVLVDEAWRHDPVRGAELMQAISPTQATRPGAQTVFLSTMGTAASTWFHSWVDRGRAGDPAVTIIEYGIGDDADPDDLELVIAAHPAVGHLIDRTFIEREHAKLERNEFARAYGNARTAVDARYLDLAVWNGARTDAAPTGPVTFAPTVAMDRTRSSIVAAAGGVAELVDARPGPPDWLAARVAELRDMHAPADIVVDRVGPAASVADDLDRLKIPVRTITTAEYSTACVQLVDDLRSGVSRFRGHPLLDEAADAAVPRAIGDGQWCWGRRRSGGPVNELEGLTLALWGDAHRPAPAVRPRVRA